MTDKQIKEQLKSLKKTHKELIKQGPEACRKFLVDAGILKNKRKKKVG